MKLDYLHIEGFKNLNDFKVDFDTESLFTVVIGWNGTGKSNLFEALVIIFRDLDLEQITPFKYHIVYNCRNAKVTLQNDPTLGTRSKTLKCTIEPDGQSPKTSLKSLNDFLPSYVFGYYSGPSQRLKEHFFEHKKRYYEKVIKDENIGIQNLKALRKFFCAENSHAKYALLAFFSQQNDSIRKFLKDNLRIEGLESVLFIMKKPQSWGKANKHLWGASGLVRSFLDRLYDLALAPMQLSQTIPISTKKRTTEQHLYLYIKDIERLQELAECYSSPNDFFAAMESTDLSEVIHDVQIRVKIRNYDGELTYRELSEGEQQLLMVLGLLRFTKEEEALILLDEPDTHLNPHWGTEYLDMLRDVVAMDGSDTPQESRHILMATHDPLVISGLVREQIQILKRDETTDHCYAKIPDRSPRGMGFEGILTSDMFGFRSALDRPTIDLLDEKRRLLPNLDSKDTDERMRAHNRISEINDIIGDIDFSNVVRDEYFSLFSRAMADYEKKESIKGNALNPEEYKKRKQFAHDFVAKIKEKRA